MSQEVIDKIIGKVFSISIEIALLLWREILLWVCSSLIDWIQKEMIPLLEKTVKLAFMDVNFINHDTLYAVKDAWEEVKNKFLEMIIEYENSVYSTAWKRRVTSMMVKKIEANLPVVVKREIEEDIDWDILPQKVRATWLKSNENNYKLESE
ncbi:hypothetical protein [Nostoc sp. CCY0012]|uniref:hypothetical protein n=1 Tax=Nostoc sp. CCY0012 TaxID=1056123 RepID=UPI0039C706B4